MTEKSKEQLNRLCCHCIRHCKQPESIVMLECPRYQPRPFKSEELNFRQLDLFS